MVAPSSAWHPDPKPATAADVSNSLLLVLLGVYLWGAWQARLAANARKEKAGNIAA